MFLVRETIINAKYIKSRNMTQEKLLILPFECKNCEVSTYQRLKDIRRKGEEKTLYIRLKTCAE